jgi:hypothetical protein
LPATASSTAPESKAPGLLLAGRPGCYPVRCCSNRGLSLGQRKLPKQQHQNERERETCRIRSENMSVVSIHGGSSPCARRFRMLLVVILCTTQGESILQSSVLVTFPVSEGNQRGACRLPFRAPSDACVGFNVILTEPRVQNLPSHDAKGAVPF